MTLPGWLDALARVVGLSVLLLAAVGLIFVALWLYADWSWRREWARMRAADEQARDSLRAEDERQRRRSQFGDLRIR